MAAKPALISDGKKFLWDGVIYDTEESATKARASYEKDAFEIRCVTEDDKFFVYTRRLVAAPVAQS